MKKRLGFVTNSSSSSFICEICDYSTGGWDMCLSDAEMCECENDHQFCIDHVDTTNNREALVKRFYEESRKLLKDRQNKDGKVIDYLVENNKTIEDILNLSVEEIVKIFEDEFEWNATDEIEWISNNEYISIDQPATYGLLKEMCPLCMHDMVTSEEMMTFAMEKLGVTLTELEEMTKQALIEKENK